MSESLAVVRPGQRVRFVGGLATDRDRVVLLAALENDGVGYLAPWS